MIIFSILVLFSHSQQTIQPRLLYPEESDILHSLSDSSSDIGNATHMSEISISMIAGDRYYVNFSQPYGLLMIRKWDNIFLSIRTIDPTTSAVNIYPSATNSEPIVGFYFYNQIGLATFVASQDTRLSFDTVIFPEECTTKYVSNTINSGVTIHPSDLAQNTNYCYFNSAKQPITYIVNYSLGTNALNFIDNNDTTSVSGTGFNDYTFDTPVLIQVESESVLHKTRYVSVRMASSNTETPNYKYSSSLTDISQPVYLQGYKKKTSKLSSSSIFGIVIVVCLFVALAAYAIFYIVVLIKRRRNRRNQQQARNVENNQEDTDTNNNTSTTNREHPHVRIEENPNGAVNSRDETGRYKTPAHVNIEVYTSQFQQTKPTDTSNSTFMNGKPSHFDTDLNEPGDANAYPTNEYHPPVKGFAAPAHLYDESNRAGNNSDIENASSTNDSTYSERQSFNNEVNSEAREKDKEEMKKEEKEKEDGQLPNDNQVEEDNENEV